MKEMNEIENYTDKEWQELSSLLSGEKDDNKDLLNRFKDVDRYNTIKYWKELREMNDDKEIDVDKAWDKLYSRLNENIKAEPETKVIKRSFAGSIFFRIAATLIILVGIGSVLLYLNNKDVFSPKTVVATTASQKNLQVTLPDGSNIYLNRNTKLTYKADFGKHGRNVTLSGEAFFDISHDDNKPFTIDAGKATVRVLGTSFNVISSNPESDVEVFVKTGQVMVSSINGDRNLILEPGFIGKMNTLLSEKTQNNDPNYLSWNTGILIYDGQLLEKVFTDLKKVYNMDIVADNSEILKNTWTTNGTLDNLSRETIIRLICTSFNLSYKIDGTVYHLAEK